jgi:hypothetical protein
VIDVLADALYDDDLYVVGVKARAVDRSSSA